LEREDAGACLISLSKLNGVSESRLVLGISLHDLEVAQKSSIATLFRVNINSLVALTLALADVSSMAVRKECLQLSRLHSLSNVFDSIEWTDHALPYVSASLALPHPSTLIKFSSRAELLEELHFEPRVTPSQKDY
jgi:hypothetical protein